MRSEAAGPDRAGTGVPAGHVPHPPWFAPRSPGDDRLSITDFLTDGALAGLCEQLTRLTGVVVSLRDRDGRRIVRCVGVTPPWRVESAAGRSDSAELAAPLVVDGEAIGALVMSPPPGTPASLTEHLQATLELVAQTATELCRGQLDLRHRLRELEALYHLSSLLVRATDLDAVLQIALDSALDVLRLDAGSVVLFEEEDGPRSEQEEDLVLKAARHLSREWLDSPLPLSKGRLFDRLALRGEVVVSEDLLTDERVLIREQVAREGLRAAIHAGLVVQGRAIGVLRLYARQPRRFRDSERRLLAAIAHHAAVAVEQARLRELRQRDEQLQRQIQLAADVQRRMLPRGLPAMPGLDVAARYNPSFELGGDFYDFFELPGNLGVAIGDVAGKGLAAALLMSSVRASLRAHVQDVYHLDEVMARVNAALVRDTLEQEFATIWYGVVDTASLRLTYCSAGHEPPFVVRCGSSGDTRQARPLIELSVGGMAVGIDRHQRYERGMCDLTPGDVLVACTDGVTDTLNFSGERFGRVRLHQTVLDLLAAEPNASAGRIVEHIFWSLRQFAGVRERPDDQTVVVVRVRG